MKKLAFALAAVAVACTGFAAEPVVVWDRDFTTRTKGVYTLSENENTWAEGYLQISGNNGILVTSTDALNVFTVIMRCDGLNLAANNAQVLFTSYGTDAGAHDNLTGVNLPTNNAPCRGIWQGADWNNGATQGSVPANYTTLIYNHQQTSGTYAYALGPTSSTDETVVRTTLYSVVGLRSSSSTYKGFSIGGLRGTTSTTLLPATGLKITSIAVFSGTLTEAEMKGYYFPSEIQTINVQSDTAVSAINAQYESTTYKAAKVTVTSGVTITVDEAFSEKIQSVSSTGSITLSAASQPDASYNLANVDFSGVQGGLLRSWLTPGVVGFNFRSASGTDVSDALATTENWVHDNNSANATSTAMFADGLSTLTWSSANTWACSGSTIISGYLDDGANGGNGAAVTLSNVPYETYDVIVYCSSDSNPGQFLAKTVNGTTYTWDTSVGAVVAGNAAWGKAALSTPVYGVNALRIKNLSGPLTIYGGARSGSIRGGIAAIEIMPPDTPDNITYYTLALNGTATTWSGGTWTLNGQTVAAPASGYVEIEASASTVLTVDQAVNLVDLKVRGGENIVVNIAAGSGSLSSIKATVKSGVLQQGTAAVLGATPSVVVEGGATFDMNGMAVDAANAFSIAGAGAGNWPWALTSSSGAGGAILGGLYLSANATIGGENELKVGQTQAGYQCYLQGFTLTKTGGGAFTGTNMNTPGTGTIDVQGGAMSVNQWNNLNSASGDTTVILNSGTSLANGTDRVISMSTLGLYGGTLSTASKAFKVNTAFRGAGETANLAFGDGASASLTGDLTVTATMTLDGSMTFLKDQEAAADVVVTPAVLTASSGTITVGAGVTLNLGTSRPACIIAVDDDGALGVQLQSAGDVVILSLSSQPQSLVVYDENGDQLDSPRVSYSNGTLTIMAHLPTLPAVGATAFDTVGNWEGGVMPGLNEDAIIELSGDAEITVSGTYILGNLTITGSGEAVFSGSGAIQAANLIVRNGAALVRNATISATTGIDIDSGTVLKIDGVTESAVISGGGSVETYGNVDMAALNTFTGGITAKSGTLTTSAASTQTSPAWLTGFGPYQTGWSNANLKSITVEDGACVDINHVIDNGIGYKLTIVGKGVEANGVYSGAVKYTGANAQGYGARQLSNITLTGDALVDLGAGWGLVHHGYGAATLALGGHTLTIRASNRQNFPIQNLTVSSAGTIVLEGATLLFGMNEPCNLSGATVIAKGGSTLDFDMSPTAIGAVVIAPSATASVAVDGYSMMTNVVPAVKTYAIDPAVATPSVQMTLMTTDANLTAGGNVTLVGSSRFEVSVSGQNVVATMCQGLPAPFLHYDFNGGSSIAEDSRFSLGSSLSPQYVSGWNGEAGVFDNNTKPWYDSNTSGMSPFHAGEMTAISLVKVREVGNKILWNFGSGWNDGMALIAKDASTISLVSWAGGADGSDVVSVSGIDNLVGKWHLVTIVAGLEGTTLYVDDQHATVGAVLPSGISAQGQFGSIHGTVKNYSGISGDGFLLDDWRVYDATLTHEEVKALKSALLPKPFNFILR